LENCLAGAEVREQAARWSATLPYRPVIGADLTVFAAADSGEKLGFIVLNYIHRHAPRPTKAAVTRIRMGQSPMSQIFSCACSPLSPDCSSLSATPYASSLRARKELLPLPTYLSLIFSLL
jgi:hypothetical protein